MQWFNVVALKQTFPRSALAFQSRSLLLLAAIAIGLGGCIDNTPSSPTAVSPSPQSSSLNSPKLQVVTTFIPITNFTKAVAGDRAEVNQLLPPNVGPHDYQAKPEDIQKLAKAQVLVENGLGMEEFLDDLVANAGNPHLKVVDSSTRALVNVPVLRVTQSNRGMRIMETLTSDLPDTIRSPLSC
jgi:ABC-type Zn uptake system ZnuABC Zn-binding protein ZnuA